MAARISPRQSLSWSGQSTRLWLALALCALLLLMGGGSRGDIAGLAILRPAAILMGAYAVTCLTPSGRAAIAPFAALLAIFVLLAGLHLIPLPPEIWQALPARESLAALDRALGMGDLWRPLALSPVAAWNALFAGLVVLCALLVFGCLEPEDRARLPMAWLGIALASACWGLAQLMAGPDSGLYTFAVTNRDFPVGHFANANHQAVFLAASLPVLALWAKGWGGDRRDPRLAARRLWPALFGLSVLVLAVVLAASRAGVALMLPNLALALLVLFARDGALAARRGRSLPWFDRIAPLLAGKRALVVLGLAIAGAGALVLSADPFESAAQSQGGLSDELRVSLLPELLAMLRQHWLFGVGAGGFAPAYQIGEPAALLSPYFLNEAHNDWLQLGIEYGLAGMLVLALGLLLGLREGLGIVALGTVPWVRRAAMLAPPITLAVASLVDYPLRTPTAACLLAVWLAYLRQFRLERTAPAPH